ncbi:MAG TPA: hypothetical protein VE109_07425 [Acidobacteriaceae bacterium]|nr:hypothetical protein [Acidobacteriaceae bacterium]
MKNALPLWKTLGLTAMIAIAPIALAQNLPAGVGGYWKITKMYPKKPVATPGCTANPAFFSKMARGSRVLMSDRNIVWGGTSATDPAARVSMVDPEEFSAHHSQAGATMHELSLDRGSKVEVITLGAPGTLPFDTVVLLDPSRLYFERCGIFMEAVHDSGFVAPPLPNQQQ